MWFCFDCGSSLLVFACLLKLSHFVFVGPGILSTAVSLSDDMLSTCTLAQPPSPQHYAEIVVDRGASPSPADHLTMSGALACGVDGNLQQLELAVSLAAAGGGGPVTAGGPFETVALIEGPLLAGGADSQRLVITGGITSTARYWRIRSTQPGLKIALATFAFTAHGTDAGNSYPVADVTSFVEPRFQSALGVGGGCGPVA